jgi:hypothetical protein
MVKANVDKIIDELKISKTLSVNDLSKHIGLTKQDIEKSAEYLEQDGVIKIEHKFPHTMFTLLKDPEAKNSDIPTAPPLPPQPVHTSPENSIASPQIQMPIAQSPSPVNQGQGMPLPPSVNPANNPQGFQQPVTQSMAPLPLTNPDHSVQTPPIIPFDQQGVKNNTTFDNQPFLSQNKENMGPLDSFQTSSNENVRASMSVMNKENLDMTSDPLNPDKPKFTLAPPIPQEVKHESVEPVLNYSQEFVVKPKEELKFPEYIKTDVDKIDFFVEKLNDKITKHQNDNLNSEYRKLYDLFKNSNNLSPNERYVFSEKINELFDRIRTLYIIEEIS